MSNCRAHGHFQCDAANAEPLSIEQQGHEESLRTR